MIILPNKSLIRQRGFLSPGQIGIWSTGVSAPTDPNFANVSALLHFNGADASTTFTDVKGKTWTPAGNAQIDTAQSKFGGASGLFDGSGDYISTASHADFGFGTGDYTVEMWVRAANTGDRTLFDNRTGGGQGIAIYASVSVPSNPKKLCLANNSAVIAASSSAIPDNTWTHVAVARSGTTVKGFIGGTEEFSVTDSRTYAASAGCFVGANSSGTQAYLGHIDDLRITKGVARYTAGFTPPTAAFPDS